MCVCAGTQRFKMLAQGKVKQKTSRRKCAGVMFKKDEIQWTGQSLRFGKIKLGLELFESSSQVLLLTEEQEKNKMKKKDKENLLQSS